jgi:geranylgeranyl reductase family protein
VRIIVAGAGPAGAMAALELAREGADVVLAEKRAWPREKTCGDAISPLGIAEGRECGISIEGCVRLPQALIGVPSGRTFRGKWPQYTPWGTTIARNDFDALLVDAAIRAGATFHPETPVVRLRHEGDALVATVGDRRDSTRDIVVDAAIVADGASGGIASSMGFSKFRSRLVALRGYIDSAVPLDPEYGLFFDRMLAPGYGWIFPMNERRANVGILLDEATLARSRRDLRGLFATWFERSPLYRERFGGSVVSDVRGGIIPSGRRNRAIGRVFLAGDAAGVADPFTAEGIFQAMSSGKLAARSLAQSPDVETARRRYERELAVFDRNERVARAMRATFRFAIDPYARRAEKNAEFAGHLASEVFFLKRSFAGFVWGLTRAW